MKFKDAEKFRSKHPTLPNTKEGDDYGYFRVITDSGSSLNIISAPSTEEWQHVSVSTDHENPPTWNEMCFVKQLFWNDEEVVIQFHPRKSQYVNFAKNCLHLWRHRKLEKEYGPPPWLVGPMGIENLL